MGRCLMGFTLLLHVSLHTVILFVPFGTDVLFVIHNEIVVGLFKLTYVPKRDTLDRLAEYGSLPVIDYMVPTRFEERVEDYIVSGNCIGELSVLTGRPYDCTIIADTSNQAYILSHDVVEQVFQRNPDPITGLEAKMWKCISVKLATSILMDTPTYQSATQIRFQLERSFVPSLSHYKIFGVNDMMEDIMLIEGVAFDYDTRDCYTAPCYVPRTVQKIVLPRSSYMNFETTVETKLLIIPARDVDEFDIMEREEEISEMVSTASSKCLQHVVQIRQLRLKRKRKRQTMFNMSHRRRVKYEESKMSGSPSVYVSRSRITNASLPDETEVRNINMQEGTSLQDSYVLNERHPSLGDRRISKQNNPMDRRWSERPISGPPKRTGRDISETEIPVKLEDSKNLKSIAERPRNGSKSSEKHKSSTPGPWVLARIRF